MILLVGAGPMAVSYAKVLQGLGQPFITVGRGAAAVEAFHAATGERPFAGGLDALLSAPLPSLRGAIVAVGVEALAEVSLRLMEHGIRDLLLEKPGGRSLAEIEAVAAAARRHGARVTVAYNRRCYASVRKARELIAEDGGVRSFSFEITEWSERIAPLNKGEGVKENWFLGNTSHVADLAFHLGGEPVELHCLVAGALPWHSRAARFAGAGRTADGALFSYGGDWEAPGRWGVEILTARRRFILRPLEELRVQQLNSVGIEPLPLDDPLDRDYKPGLYVQVQRFLAGGAAGLCTLEEHLRLCRHYVRMAGYA